jgi:Putative heavy-metal chelation
MLKELRQRVARILPKHARRIEGIHHVQYKIQWTASAVPLDLRFLAVVAGATGCCFFDETADLRIGSLKKLVGLDVLELEAWPQAVQVAALDAAYGATSKRGGRRTTIHGLPHEKAAVRAEIVAREVVAQLKASKAAKPNQVAYVGVVGEIVEAVNRRRPVRCVATDFSKQVIGRKILDTVVISGNDTLAAVAGANVAVVTGMTIGNGTLGEILRVAKKNNTRIVMFAQTGANLGRELIKLGADAVIAEPFPFYNIGSGPTDIICYRR